MTTYKIKITTCEHRGGLKEALITEKEVSIAWFLIYVNEYDYYAFDERLKAHRFLIKDLKNNFIKKRDWLNVYILEVNDG